MSNDIELGVSEMFRDAVKQNIVTELRTQDDWDRFNTIDESARKQTADEQQTFEREHSDRLAAARKDIIDKAGSLNLEHPTPFGTDKFDKAAIDRQAHRRVENDHQNRIMAISRDESEAYVGLRDDILTREGNRGHARDAFNQSTDRRNGEERRMPSQNRRTKPI